MSKPTSRELWNTTKMFELQLISRMEKEDGGKGRDHLCTPVQTPHTLYFLFVENCYPLRSFSYTIPAFFLCKAFKLWEGRWGVSISLLLYETKKAVVCNRIKWLPNSLVCILTQWHYTHNVDLLWSYGQVKKKQE